MKYIIYWLISYDCKKTYVGFSGDINNRIKKHKNKQIKSTLNFGKFKCFKLEEVNGLIEARAKEKYWKSHAGRKKLKQYFDKIKMVPSSNG